MQKKVVHIDGEGIVYVEEGRGESLVLLPGLGCSLSLWEKVIPLLSQKYKVYAFDLPVYGKYNFNTYPLFLEKIMYQFNMKNPTLIGHSLGGLISLLYTASHAQNIKKLILVSVPLTDHRYTPLSWKLVDTLILESNFLQEMLDWCRTKDYIVDPLRKIAFPDRLTDLSSPALSKDIRLPMKAIAQCFADIFAYDFKPFLEKVTVPTLLIYGDKDKPLLRFGGTALYDLFPQAKIISLPGQHFIPQDVPEKLSEIISAFLSDEKI